MFVRIMLTRLADVVGALLLQAWYSVELVAIIIFQSSVHANERGRSLRPMQDLVDIQSLVSWIHITSPATTKLSV